MPATSADNSILATGRPVRIPAPDDPSGFPNYYRNFRLTTLDLRLIDNFSPCSDNKRADTINMTEADIAPWGANWAWGLPLILLTVVIHVFGLALINDGVVRVLDARP